VCGELTYGLERIAMYLQDKENIFDVEYAKGMRYGEIFQRAEREWSTYNFEEADVEAHFHAFDHFEGEVKRLLSRGHDKPADAKVPVDPTQALVLPAYDFVVKAAHTFNVLDARGAISVTERQRFIGRVRGLARAVAEAWIAQRQAMGFPLLARDVRPSTIPPWAQGAD
jgi:glycyl-tRNA synthetase alpha chain